MISVLLVGPSHSGLKGGQATHMENIKSVFGCSEKINLNIFYSSSGYENTENIIKKGIRFFYTICRFPLHLKNIDLVHINSSFDNKAIIRDLFLLLWARLLSKKTIIQYHGGNPFETKTLRNSLVLKTYINLWNKSNILILNNDQGQWFSNIKHSNFQLVKNYVTLPNLPIKRKKNKFVFTYLGRIIREKGLIEIIDAAKELEEKHTFEINIYGQGEDLAFINDHIKSTKLTGIVKLMGSVNKHEKFTVFVNTDFFLYPSYYPEGLPYSILEALSFSIPVICTNAGALKHVVTHLDTCLKVQEKSSSHLAEMMSKLMLDKHLQQKLSENSRNMIELDYSIDAMKALFLQLWCDERKA